MHKKGSLPETVEGVVNLMSFMDEHDLHLDQALGFVERRVVDVFVEFDPYQSVYCVDAATTILDVTAYLLAYSDFVSVDARPSISVPHALSVNVRLLRVSVLCVRQMLMALRNGYNFSTVQQVFDCGIGVGADGEYRLVRPDRNPGYKLAGFDDAVQWCFGVYPTLAPPYLVNPGNYYSSPLRMPIMSNNLFVTKQAAEKIACLINGAVAESIPASADLNIFPLVESPETMAVEAVQPQRSAISGQSDKLLSMKDLTKVLGFSRSKINNLRNPANERHDPTFPKPVDTGSSAVRWRESDINDWIASRKVKA